MGQNSQVRIFSHTEKIFISLLEKCYIIIRVYRIDSVVFTDFAMFLHIFTCGEHSHFPCSHSRTEELSFQILLSIRLLTFW